MTAREFARAVEALSLTITGYQTGKSGQLGLCDCIGLVMGALGKNYPLHSTNYFVRYQTAAKRGIDTGALAVGEIVYKARADTSQLNDRYQPGGRYYTGDMLDYYHVGVVTSVAPLEIAHCTSYGSISGIVRDASTKGWTHAGQVIGVDYATGDTQEVPTMSKTAYVSSGNGKPVRLRTRPTTDGDYNTIAKVPDGTVVDVLEETDGWARISTPNGDTGYMMMDFLRVLQYADEDAPQPDEDEQEAAPADDWQQQVLDRLDRLIEAVKGLSGGEA